MQIGHLLTTTTIYVFLMRQLYNFSPQYQEHYSRYEQYSNLKFFRPWAVLWNDANNDHKMIVMTIAMKTLLMMIMMLLLD